MNTETNVVVLDDTTLEIAKWYAEEAADDSWKQDMSGMMDMMEHEAVEADTSNPYLNIEEPSKFTTQSIVMGMLPGYLHHRSESVSDYAESTVHKIAGMLTALVQGLGSLVTAGRYVSQDEVEAQLTQAVAKVSKLNRILYPEGLKVNPSKMLDLADDLKWLNEDYTFTDRFKMMLQGKDKAYPTDHVQVERMQPYVKNGTKGNAALRSACDVLEATPYTVHTQMLETVQIAVAIIKQPKAFEYQDKLNALELMRPTEYVRSACSSLTGSLHSAYDGDNRARMYHIACAGPNPQAGDEERSYYSLEYTQMGCTKDSPAYNMFMGELRDIAGGFTTHKKLLWVANNSSMFLAQSLIATARHERSIKIGAGVDTVLAKKPFTLVRLAWDYRDYVETGILKSTLGFGLDAKCSGTQYFAIAAGDSNMAKATGLTTSDVKVDDPYIQSGKVLDKNMTDLMKWDTDMAFLAKFRGMTQRQPIKTPYMAVQYGGGKGALTESKEYKVEARKVLGFEANDGELKSLAEITVLSIKEALGKRINSFIEKVEDSVEYTLWEATGFKTEFVETAQGEIQEVPVLANYLTYRHVDGFKVLHKTYADEPVCPSFSLNLGGFENGAKVMDFGPKNGIYSIRESLPSGEEFVRTFCVNYIQGIDALVARTVVNKANEAGLKGITSIHDCFRTCLEDSPKLQLVIADAYKELFIDNDIVAHLEAQLSHPDGQEGFGLTFRETVVTEEILYSDNSYYFCQ